MKKVYIITFRLKGMGSTEYSVDVEFNSSIFAVEDRAKEFRSAIQRNASYITSNPDHIIITNSVEL